MATRQTIDLETEDRKAWVREEAGRRGVTERELFRQLVDEARYREDQAVQADADPRAVLLQNVAEYFEVDLAAHHSGVSTAQVREWRKCATFRRQVRAARRLFIAGVQHALVQVGKGKRGNALALLSFLNAWSDHFGGAKAGNVMKIVNPLLNRLVRILQEELGTQGEDVLERVLERFEAEMQERLSTVA